MADFEHGDYNWSDDIGTDDPEYGLEDRYDEPMTYEQMTEGLEDEVTHVYSTSIPITMNIPNSSLIVLYEYLIATNQTCFIIMYESSILSSGFVYMSDNEYKLALHIDDSTNTIVYDPRQAIDTILCNSGNSPLSYRQCPLNYIYIPGCNKTWYKMLQELLNLSTVTAI